MIIQRIKRKIHNLLHPKVGEIWMLHRVVEHRSDKPSQRVLEVSPEWLEQRILEYKKKGYTFVSIDALPKQGHWVCITLDDGYRDNYTLAYPIFKRLGVPFTVYVTTGFIDNKMPMWWYPNEQLGLRREELITLSKEPLCTIGAHTISHPRLDEMGADEQMKEVATSKRELEEALGCPVNHFSYPHGACNDSTESIVRECGFRSALMAWGGVVRKGDDRLRLPRVILKQNK